MFVGRLRAIAPCAPAACLVVAAFPAQAATPAGIVDLSVSAGTGASYDLTRRPANPSFLAEIKKLRLKVHDPRMGPQVRRPIETTTSYRRTASP